MLKATNAYKCGKRRARMNGSAFAVIGSMFLLFAFPLSAQQFSSLPAQDTSLNQGLSPFGSYDGGDVDNVDLRSGNVSIKIPLFSIPQKGKLSLSMAAFLNNGGYMSGPYCPEAQYAAPGFADGGALIAQYCTYVYQRTSAIGPLIAFDQLLLNAFPIGAAGASLISGNGPANLTAEGGVMEPNGATHQFGSISSSFTQIGASGSYTYGYSGANDGSGYQAHPSPPGDSPYGIAGAFDANGLSYQIPTIVAPFQQNPPATNAALISQPASFGPGSITDPSGNTISYVQSIASNYFGSINNANYGWTVGGPGSISQQNIQHVTGYHIVDSSGNVIPSLFEETLGSTASCPVLSNRTPLADNQPALFAIPWTVPGPNGQKVTYTICYTDVYYNTDFNQQQYGYGTPMGAVTELDLPLDAPQYGKSSTAPSGLPTNTIPGDVPVSYSEAVGEEWAIQSIILPDGTYWGFVYDSMGSWAGSNPQTASVAYGDLKELYYPTGGSIDYSYTSEQPCSGIATMPNVPQAYSRFLTSRIVHDNNGNTYNWSYQYSHGTYNASNLTAMAFTTIVTDPLGNDAVHTFQNQTLPALQTVLNAGYYPSFCSLYETGKVEYQGSHSSGIALRTTQTQYQMTLDPSDLGPNNEVLAVTNVLPKTVTVTNASGTTTTTTYTYPPLYIDPGDPVPRPYDASTAPPVVPAQISFNEPSQVTVTGSDGTTIIKNTTYQFQNNASYHATAYGAPTTNLLTLPASISVGTSSSNVASITTYGYDESGSPQGIYGNQTSVHKLIGGSQYKVTKAVYSTTSMPITTTDSNGNQTSISYDSTGIFPSEIQHPVTNGVAHNEYFTWDPITGATLSHTDENGAEPGDPAHTTKYGYDSSGRVVTLNTPDGGSTNYCYNIGTSTCSGAPANSVVKNVAINSSANMVSTTVYDGFARTIQNQINSDPDGTDYVNTTYDALGRTSSVSNPYRSGTSPAYTTYTYDALSRKTIQAQPDGLLIRWCYNGVATNQQGNCTSNLSSKPSENWVNYSDEDGHRWQHVSDSLGRMIAVMEPNGSSSAPSMETDYTYDALNDLLSVTQWGGPSGTAGDRVRLFQYDSLSRLLTATNPETGTVSYSYDANGNVLTKTDARSITTTSTYDALNRLTKKSYSDGVTPTSLFVYDVGNITFGTTQKYTTSNVIGRLSVICVDIPGACQSMTAYSYDPMGRTVETLSNTPNFPTTGAVYAVSATYDLAGDRTSLTNSTGRTFNYSYDAAGRLQTASNTVTLNGTAVTTPMVSSMAYFPSGQAQTMTTDTGSATITGTWGIDNRLRVTSYQNLSSANTAGTNYGYSLTYTPNSNVKTDAETVYNPASGAMSWSWNFGYDSLNRLTSAQSTGAVSFGCAETYDAFGNRTAQQPSGSGLSCLSVSTPVNANNRLSSPTYSYDAAGNVLTEGGNTLTYDAEGRILTAGSTSYRYDADGQRVSKITGGVETDYIRDFDGALLDTYVGGSNNLQPQEMWIAGRHYGIWYASVTNGVQAQGEGLSLTNWLGSEAVRSYTAPNGDNSGVPGVAFLSLPFGDGQTTLFGGDFDDIHFTGKERDAESGLDYFGARYYSSNMGRFMSADWYPGPAPIPYANIFDPQTLNLYIYAGNNPLSRFDPNGHNWFTDFAQGLADSTYRPIVHIVEHPIATAEGIGTAIAHPIVTGEAIGSAVKSTVVAAAHGDGRAIGQIVGTVGTAIAGGAIARGVGVAGEIGAEAGEFVGPTTSVTTSESVFYHYGFAADESKFANGLRPGSYATTTGDLTGQGAKSSLALPHANAPDSVYQVTPGVGTPVNGPSTVAPQFGQPGGGQEVTFPQGTGPGTVGPATPIPPQ